MRAIMVLLLCAISAHAAPADAVVRITLTIGRTARGETHSSGSGTVIQSRNGHSLILTAAHLWTDQREQPLADPRSTPIAIDAPWPNPEREAKHVGVRLCNIDYQADLALLEMNCESPFVCPIEHAPLAAGMNVLSVGYDEAKLPGVRVPCIITGGDGHYNFTDRIPVQGRSGGALIDDAGKLVGVCHGFQGWPGGQRGQYVCLRLIQDFLGEPGASQPQQPRPPPVCPPGGS